MQCESQQETFNRLTAGGTNQGIYLDSGNVYVNASYIRTGTLSADRIDVDGIFSKTITATGKITGGEIIGTTITGGTGSFSGAITASSLATGSRTGTTGASGCYIDSSGNFYAGTSNQVTITAAGVLSATGASITGSVTATTMLAKQQYQIYYASTSSSKTVIQVSSDTAPDDSVLIGDISGGQYFTFNRLYGMSASTSFSAPGFSTTGNIRANGTIDAYALGVLYNPAIGTGPLTAGTITGSSEGLVSNAAITAPSLASTGWLLVNTSNTTGCGIQFSDDGYMLDNQDGYITFQFISGIKSTNNIYASGNMQAAGDGIFGRLCTGLIAPSSSHSANVYHHSNNYFYSTSTSSIRYKNKERLLSSEDVESLYDVPVYWFKYKDGYLMEEDERNGVNIPGFIVEEMDPIVPIAVDHMENGDPEMWNEKVLIPLMFEMIKNEHRRNTELEEEVERLRNICEHMD